jgi:hypothetical protein
LAKADRLQADARRLQAQGNYREAVPLAEQSLALRRQVLGLDHPQTATSLNGLALIHRFKATTPRPNRSFSKR